MSRNAFYPPMYWPRSIRRQLSRLYFSRVGLAWHVLRGLPLMYRIHCGDIDVKATPRQLLVEGSARGSIIRIVGAHIKDFPIVQIPRDAT